MIGRSLHPPPPPPPDSEELIQGYPWPSSRITKADMIRLTELRTLTRRPITKLLHEAVMAYYCLLTDASERPTDGPRCCENPTLRWKSESASNCYIECASCGFVLCDDGQLADWHDPEQIAWKREIAKDDNEPDEPGRPLPATE